MEKCKKGIFRMDENKKIPEMASYEEMAEFWDAHSLADYWDQTEPAEFDISPIIWHRHVITTV